MIGKTISHYKILEKLGEGGMGVVYKARDTKLRRTVALKFLPRELIRDSDARQRLIHEAQAASGLQHNNICAIHEIGETSDGQVFICMDHYEGETLKARIERGPLPLNDALDILIQVAEGISEAHSREIIHRDIKPANVMMTTTGQAKILDFGLAKLPGRTKLTKTGMALGTVEYMSPEQARGQEVDHRTDIWALGVMLYEMLTGRAPFAGEYEQAVIYRILNEDYEKATSARSEVPGDIDHVLEKMIAKDAGERYQKVDEVLSELRAMRGISTPGRYESIQRTSSRPINRRLMRIGVPVTLVVASVSIFLLLETFQIDIRPKTKEAIAEENSMAIMYFNNLPDPSDSDRTAQMATSLLITDLSESEYVKVLSQQRMHDILKQMDKGKEEGRDGPDAIRIAGRAGTRWIVTGSILQLEPEIVIASEISDAATGGIHASQRVRGEPGEGIFTVVDKLSKEIRADMSLPDEADYELDRAVAEVTTSSKEAYRQYIEGVVKDQAFDWAGAAESYGKALECDSTFAKAYIHLANVQMLLYRFDEARENVIRAAEYSARCGWRERLDLEYLTAQIERRYADSIAACEAVLDRDPLDKRAWFDMGEAYRLGLVDLEKAIPCYETVVGLDSLYAYAYWALAYSWGMQGTFDKAIWAGRKYVALRPGEPNPYDTLGDVYAWSGRANKAVQAYNKVLEIQPDWFDTKGKIALVHITCRKYARAESLFKEFARNEINPAYRSWARSGMGIVPMFQGRLEEALGILGDAIVADRLELEAERTDKYFLRAIIHYERREFELALEELERAIQIRQARGGNPWSLQANAVLFLSEAGMFEEAEEVLGSMRSAFETDRVRVEPHYTWALGAVHLARGMPDSAAVHMKAALPRLMPWQSRAPSFLLARAYFNSGRYVDAVNALDRFTLIAYSHDDYHYLWMGKAYYLKGIAHERLGHTPEALRCYRECLDIWREADVGIVEVRDAKERLKRLNEDA